MARYTVKPQAQTLMQRMGFVDSDLTSPGHPGTKHHVTRWRGKPVERLNVGDSIHHWAILAVEIDPSRGSRVLVCQCVCGTVRKHREDVLKRHQSKSCGCLSVQLRRETMRQRHIENRDPDNIDHYRPEYRIWRGMKERCYNPHNASYQWYGEIGVIVCDRWIHSFKAFIEDVGPRPGPQYSLDRYPDHYGNYEPGNVRWATDIQQHRNTRSNHVLTVNGETLPVSEWAERTGIHSDTIYSRKDRGWDDDKAVTTPVIEKHSRRNTKIREQGYGFIQAPEVR